MKISLALGERRPLDRQTAWGCFTGNLAVPGAGSLIAGRISGYAQLLLGLAGLTLTSVFGVQFILWFFAKYSHMQSGDADPFQTMTDMWHAGRWAFLGILIFGFAWIWGLITGLMIVASSKPVAPGPRSPETHS